ncbi:ABC-type transport auxiliary lipoprotein family protein [Sulfurovum sp.]|uniref:ABC-type transport auxiliary lipoprotein family protein n=1 Tax=Sulfurovum sp. TaxID=1969726 RepID=UPI0025FA4CEA|nr:ABC-type transport auxiliary lipoprotein family protein [Sulfurovum sp.]
MRYIMLVLSFLLLSGCSFKEAPVMKVYSLLIPHVSPVSGGEYRNKILKVSYPVGLGEKLTDGMLYSYSLSDSGEYLNSRWSNNIGRLLQGSMIQILSQSRLFKVVVPYTSNIEENLRLESTIFDFSHHVRGKDSYAVVSIQFTLTNAETGKLLKAKRFSYRENTPTTDAKGYAEATNRIMVKLSRDLVRWLKQD